MTGRILKGSSEVTSTWVMTHGTVHAPDVFMQSALTRWTVHMQLKTIVLDLTRRTVHALVACRSIVSIYILVAALAFLSGCGDDSGLHKFVPGESKVSASGGPGIGYDDVKPVFAAHCAACHPSRNAPDWLEYSQASKYANGQGANGGALKQRVLLEKSMPPPSSPQAASITAKERAMLGRWSDEGAPLKAPASAPVDASGALASSGEPAGPQAQCLQCHGDRKPGANSEGLTSQSQKIPFIAGQNTAYIAEQLMSFRWKASQPSIQMAQKRNPGDQSIQFQLHYRVDPSNNMNDIANALSDSQISELALYFGRPRGGLAPDDKAWVEPTTPLYLSGKKLAVEACVSCHLNRDYGSWSSNPLVPLLAGQSKQYIINQLVSFRQGDRRSSQEMHTFAANLRNEDVEALAEYFSLTR